MDKQYDQTSSRSSDRSSSGRSDSLASSASAMPGAPPPGHEQRDGGGTPPPPTPAASVRGSLSPETLARPPSYQNRTLPPPYSEAPHARGNGGDILRTTGRMGAHFLAAALLAVGHHFFCAGINNTEATELRQRWVPIVESLMAMLAMYFFCLATLRAYYQNFAVALRENPMQLRNADLALRLPANPLAVFHWLGQGLHCSQIGLVALIYWLLPLIPIIAPSSLIVVPWNEHNMHAMLNQSMPIPDFSAEVPQLYYPKGAGPYTEGVQRGPYGKPTQQFFRLAMGAATSGKNMDPVKDPFNITAGDTKNADFLNKKHDNSDWLRNASASPRAIFEGRARYWLQFSGPAIDCSEKTYFALGYAQTLARASGKNPNAFYHAFATTPRTDDLSGTWPGDKAPQAAVDLISGVPRLFVARGVNIGTDPVWDVLECGLWNVTYEVRVTQVNRTIVADKARELKPAATAASASSSAGVMPGVPQGGPLEVKQQDLDDMERRFSAARTGNGSDQDRRDAARYEALKSYLAVMHAFGDIMAGTVGWSDGGYDVWRTKILYTRLSEHIQFRKVASAKVGPESDWNRTAGNRDTAPPPPPAQKQQEHSKEKRAAARAPSTEEERQHDSWGGQIEQMFMDIVMSLLSDKRFLTPVGTGPEASIGLMFPSYGAPDQFQYSPEILAATYGVAALLVLLVLLSGHGALVRIGASYRPSFATALVSATYLDALLTHPGQGVVDELSGLPKDPGKLPVSLQPYDDARNGNAYWRLDWSGVTDAASGGVG